MCISLSSYLPALVSKRIPASVRQDAELTNGAEAFELGPDSFLLRRGSTMVHVAGADAAAAIKLLGFECRRSRADDDAPGLGTTTLALLSEAGLTQRAAASKVPKSPVRSWTPPVGVEVDDPRGLLGVLDAAAGRDRRTPAITRLRLVVVRSWWEAGQAAINRQADHHAILVVADAEHAWLTPVLGRAGVDAGKLMDAVHRHDDVGAVLLNAGVAPLEHHSARCVSPELVDRVVHALTGLAGERSSLTPRVLEIRTDRYDVVAHPIPELDPAVQPPGCQPILSLTARHDTSGIDNEDLLDAVHDRLGPLIDKVTGLLTPARLVPAKMNRSTAFVAIADYAAPSPIEGRLYELRPTAPARLVRRQLPTRTGFGADWTRTRALAKATLEAYERYIIEANPRPTTVRSTPGALSAPAYWLQCESMPLGHGRTVWRSNTVEPNGDSAADIQWVTASGLDGSVAYLPAALVYKGAAAEDDRIAYEPSGSALGFSRDETVLRGLLEVIERDAISRWWYGLTQPRPVPAETLSADVERFVAGQAGAGRRVELQDATCWTRVPVVTAWLIEPGHPPVLGFGCAVTLADAVESAVLELAEAACFADQQRRGWPLNARRTAHLVGESHGSPRPAAEFVAATTSPMTAVRAIADHLGLPVLVHDLPTAVAGIHGVKVAVPSLYGLHGTTPCEVGDWPRFPA